MDPIQVIDAVDQIAGQCDLVLCVECGKCVAVCPMAKIFGFDRVRSPREMVERALKGQMTLELAGIWYCLTCDLCTNLCPVGVRLRDFIEAARWMCLEAGLLEHSVFCRTCGVYVWPRPTVEYLTQVLEEPTEGFLSLCPRCRRQDLAERVKALLSGGMQVSIRYTQRGDTG